MKEFKWERRERKQHKAKTGMRVTGHSIFVIVEVQVKKGKKARQQRGA